MSISWHSRTATITHGRHPAGNMGCSAVVLSSFLLLVVVAYRLTAGLFRSSGSLLHKLPPRGHTALGYSQAQVVRQSPTQCNHPTYRAETPRYTWSTFLASSGGPLLVSWILGAHGSRSGYVRSDMGRAQTIHTIEGRTHRYDASACHAVASSPCSSSHCAAS
ncbi:hypothetical protein C8Q77DRAFT_410557 [Trametes polyzona]|nr:hypothetical protein C8Q77DRAFT_410557 [Trametes polyzona]